MQAERRSVYRVPAERDDAIRAEVVGQSGRAFGDVLDLSLNGAAVRIAITENPTFSVGEPVTVHFLCTPAGQVEVQAKVQARSELDDSRRFGFAFEDPAALRKRLNGGLLRLFNQRKAFRVELGTGSQTAVRIRTDGPEALGRLLNVSADGVAVLVDPQVEAQLSDVVSVSVAFQLPGDDEALIFRAVIRNRAQMKGGDGVYYGLELDRTSSSDFIAQQRRLVDYVMQRQGESLEAQVER
jgi:hypothetical protein